MEQVLVNLVVNARDAIDGHGAITLTVGGNTLSFKGLDYLNSWVLPNFYFHAATAYNLLRHGGVDLGKKDYLMGSEA